MILSKESRLRTLLITLFFITSFNTIANEEKSCPDLKDDMESACRYLERKCEDIQKCMVRRDVCFENGAPTSEEECLSAKTCVKNLDNSLNNDNCVYYWSTSSNIPRCMTQRKIFRDRNSCPGRLNPGFLGLNWAAWGTKAAFDDEYKCTAPMYGYRAKKDHCEEKISEFRQKCSQHEDTESLAKASEPDYCDYDVNFEKYPLGSYSYNVDSGAISNSARNYQAPTDSSSNSSSNSGSDLGR